MAGQAAVEMNDQSVENPVLERAFWAGRRDFARLEARVAACALPGAVDLGAEGLAIPCAGGVIVARPLDLRRFVRAMARHICFN